MNNIIELSRNGIIEALKTSVQKAIDSKMLPMIELPVFTVEIPREKEHGDFATNIAMVLSKSAKKPPREVAKTIVSNFEIKDIPIENIEIAGPGFINFYLKWDWLHPVIEDIIEQGNDYGRVNIGKGKKVQVEFVSANPTGLLHMGNARGAALGDSIASILQFAGFDVEREYYINDAGNQIENFAKSLEVRYLQHFGENVSMPEDGYHGEDIIQTVNNFIAECGDKYLKVDSIERRKILVEFALKEKIANIEKSLLDFGIKYDNWFSERHLHEKGIVDATIEELKKRGYTYEEEGAVWFKAREFGDDKDEVLIRANGSPTYFAADIAYHKNKFERGFEHVIDIWGADHHGHVKRMKGAMRALGYSPDSLEVILMQLVRLVRGGEIVRMSKRTGNVVTLSEILEEVGRDAARYFFVMRSADTHLEFDIDLAKSQSNDNPVFYIQYAHARICSILRQAADEGKYKNLDKPNLALLKEQAEIDLIKKLAVFPMEVSLAAEMRAPHRIAKYAHELAGLFHSFYNAYRVIVPDVELSFARLALVRAVKTVIFNALKLVGVSAPERM